MNTYKITNLVKFVLIILVVLISLSGNMDIRGTESLIGMTSSSNSTTNLLFPVIYINKLKLIQAIEAFTGEAIKLNESNKQNITEEEPDTDIPKTEEFLAVNVEDVFTDEDKKIAFLTFDDGPSKYVTPRILDILDEYNIKATFFVLGSMCDKNENILKDVYDRKHSIGNHSYSHVYKSVYKSETSFINEIEMTDKALKRILGDDFSTRLFRFPGGSFEAYKKPFFKPLNEAGYISIDWNAVTGDSEVAYPTQNMLMSRLKSTTKNKNNIIILMHDTDAKQATADALPDVIKYLQSEGYEFAIIK